MDVLSILDSKGLNYKPLGGNEYAVECINSMSHSGGTDQNYSMFLNIETLQIHCFVCNFSMNTAKTTAWLLGDELDEMSMKCLELRGKLKRAGAISEICVEEQGEVFVPPGEPWVEDYRGISAETYRKLGAFKCNRGRFQNRICFEMYFDGVLRGIEGRALGAEIPKYLRTSGFNAKKYSYPYDLVKAAKPEYVVLVEGIFDAINLYDKIGSIGLCIYGTENFGLEKLRTLLALGTNEICLFLDRDDAGQVAQKKIGTMLQDWFTVSEACVDRVLVDPRASLAKGKLCYRDCGDLDREELLYCLENRTKFK